MLTTAPLPATFPAESIAPSPFWLGTRLLAQPADELHPLPVAELHRLLTTDMALARQVERLRAARALDAAAYRQLKLQLPYFVGSTFRPAHRHRQHLVAAGAMVLDFDHLPATGLSPALVREQLRQDARVWLAFTSPSGEGLKVVLGLAQPESDATRFAAFYRDFAARFAAEHGLVASLDPVTHDPTRVCLLSHDPDAWLNPYPELLEPEQCTDFGMLLVAPKPAPVSILPLEVPATTGPAPELLDELLRRLNPDRRATRPAPPTPVVPAALYAIQEPVRVAAAAQGLAVLSVTDISYGQRFTFGLGKQFGEVNVFLGKRGYSVVKTTKCGSEPRLAEAGRLLLEEVLYGLDANAAPAEDQPLPLLDKLFS